MVWSELTHETRFSSSQRWTIYLINPVKPSVVSFSISKNGMILWGDFAINDISKSLGVCKALLNDFYSTITITIKGLFNVARWTYLGIYQPSDGKLSCATVQAEYMLWLDIIYVMVVESSCFGSQADFYK